VESTPTRRRTPSTRKPRPTPAPDNIR
jgi:hypothetical protein